MMQGIFPTANQVSNMTVVKHGKGGNKISEQIALFKKSQN